MPTYLQPCISTRPSHTCPGLHPEHLCYEMLPLPHSCPSPRAYIFFLPPCSLPIHWPKGSPDLGGKRLLICVSFYVRLPFCTVYPFPTSALALSVLLSLKQKYSDCLYQTASGCFLRGL